MVVSIRIISHSCLLNFQFYIRSNNRTRQSSCLRNNRKQALTRKHKYPGERFSANIQVSSVAKSYYFQHKILIKFSIFGIFCIFTFCILSANSDLANQACIQRGSQEQVCAGTCIVQMIILHGHHTQPWKEPRVITTRYKIIVNKIQDVPM